jgi:predicted unusual protein kinase regulating ubiquinone biosynthesis (AarF/ABC1/UbiB family)
LTETGVAQHGIETKRYWRITTFFGGMILHVIWWDLLLRRVAPNRVQRTRPERFRRLAHRFRELAVEMGGVMIKAGQFLSARVDVLPTEITDELAGLQDEVPAEPIESICQVIEEELGRPPSELFAAFEYEPQAAASLGQTHRAWLPDGQGGRGDPVVLKVQRMGIERLIQTDLSALRQVASWLSLYSPLRRRVDVPALVEELARTTWEEVDYVAEADNAERFAEMFREDPGVTIPAVYRKYSTGRVLLLENVEAIKITDLKGIERAGVSRAQVAARLMDVYLRQVFEEGFFHADPHPGNLFIHPLGPELAAGQARPFRLVFVDFGMVGRVPAQTGEQLREILLALALRDARRMVQAFRRLHFFLPGADLERVEAAVARLFDQFWGMSMEELARVDYVRMQALALEFRDLLFEMPFQVPQDFIYLGRTVGILAGLATAMDPHFNPWVPVERYGQRLLRRQEGLPDLQGALQTLLHFVRPLIGLPQRLETFLELAERGELAVRLGPDRALERQLRNTESASRRTLWAIVFAALLTTGTALYISGEPGLGIAGWSVASLSLLWGLITGRRH